MMGFGVKVRILAEPVLPGRIRYTKYTIYVTQANTIKPNVVTSLICTIWTETNSHPLMSGLMKQKQRSIEVIIPILHHGVGEGNSPLLLV